MFKTANLIGLIKAAQEDTPQHYPGVDNVSVEPYTAPAPTSYGHRMRMDEWKDAERARLRGLHYDPDQIETMLTNKAYRKSNGGRNYVSTKGFKVRNKEQDRTTTDYYTMGGGRNALAQEAPGVLTAETMQRMGYAQPRDNAAAPHVDYTISGNQALSKIMRDTGFTEYAQRKGYAQPQENVVAKWQPSYNKGFQTATNTPRNVADIVNRRLGRMSYAGERPLTTSFDNNYPSMRYEDPFSSSNIQFPVGNFGTPMRGADSAEESQQPDYTADYGTQSNARRDAGLLNLFDSRNKA